MFADDQPTITVVEIVVRPVEVRVPLILEVVEVGHVRVAVRILPLRTNVPDIVYTTTLRVLSGLHRIRNLKIP